MTVFTTSTSMRVFWRLSLGLLTYGTLYLLTIVPFFAYSIHTKPINLIFDSAFDPKFYPLYAGSAGEVLLYLTYLIALFAPIFGSVTGVYLWRWRVRNKITLNRVQQIVSYAAFTAAAMLTLFCLTPLGRTFYLWMLD